MRLLRWLSEMWARRSQAHAVRTLDVDGMLERRRREGTPPWGTR